MTITASLLQGTNHGSTGANTRSFSAVTLTEGRVYVAIVMCLQNGAGAYNPLTTFSVSDDAVADSGWETIAASADPGSTGGGSNPTSCVVAVTAPITATEAGVVITVDNDDTDSTQYLSTIVLIELATDADPIGVVQVAGSVATTATTLNWPDAPSGFLVTGWGVITSGSATFPAEPAGYTALYTTTNSVNALEVHTGDGVATDPVTFSPTASPSNFSFHAVGVEFSDSTGGAELVDLADTVALSDAVAVAAGRAVTLADSIGATDALAVTAARHLDLADTVGLSDAVLVAAGRHVALTDTLSLSDDLGLVADAAVALHDLLSLSDALSIDTTGAAGLDLDDALALADVLQLRVDAVLGFADTVGLSDALSIVRSGVVVPGGGTARVVRARMGNQMLRARLGNQVVRVR